MTSFVLYLILFHATWTVWVLFGYPHLRALGEHTLAYALLNIAVRLVLWVLPVFLYLKLVDRVDPIEYLKLKQHWSRGIVVAMIFSALNLALMIAQRGLPHLRAGALTWNTILSTSLLIGFMEEIPYRGFIFQKLGDWFSFPTATLLSSLLFLAIHLPGWLSLHLFQPRVAIFVFVFGVVMVLLLRYTKSLWAPIVSHSLNDFMSAVLFGGG
jgi:membrane protease YdiL (CAAX protease family)